MKTIITIFILTLLVFGVGCVSNDGVEVQDFQENQEGNRGNNNNTLAEKQPLSGSPYWHDIRFITSKEENWNDGINVIFEHGSVPDAIVLNKDVGDFKAGTLMTIFVYFEKEESEIEEIGMLYSEDNGKTWSDIIILVIDGAEGHVPVDPSIIQLEDGSLVLYYFDFSVMKNSKIKKYIFYGASSTDGLHFTVEQPIFSSEKIITDPDVIYFNDQWRMFYATPEDDARIHVTTGTDHLNFGNEVTTGIEGIPGTIIVDGELHLYGCGTVNGAAGITTSTSTDGTTFTDTKIVKMGDCDPAPVQLNDGSYGLIVKGFMDVENK